MKFIRFISSLDNKTERVGVLVYTDTVRFSDVPTSVDVNNDNAKTGRRSDCSDGNQNHGGSYQT